MTIPEQAVQAALTAWNAWQRPVEDAMRAAISAALDHITIVEPSAGRAAVLEEALRKMVALYESEYDADVPFKRPDWLVSALHPVADKPDEAGAQGEGWKQLEQAARNLIANRFDTYKARNGKLCSIEGDDGEKAWIVPFDAMAELESALSSPDHADAGKVEGEGWLPIESAPKDGTAVLAYQAGRYFKCWLECDQYEGGYFWQDEEDSEPSPTHWRPLPTPPSSEVAE